MPRSSARYQKSPPTTPPTQTWVIAIFVDLVTAFDTVHHDLLRQILIKYGLPPPIVKNIQKLYQNCKEKIGEIPTEINYSTRVHQGDNMSSILFLFVIQDSLTPCGCKTHQSSSTTSPKIKTASPKPSKADFWARIPTPKDPFSSLINSSFYINDSSFLCQSREELQQTIIQLS